MVSKRGWAPALRFRRDVLYRLSRIPGDDTRGQTGRTPDFRHAGPHRYWRVRNCLPRDLARIPPRWPPMAARTI